MRTAALEQVLNQAFQHHNAGEWQQADALYRKVLEALPDQPQALHLSGVLALQFGDTDTAIERLTRAVEVTPNDGEARFHLGVALQSAGRAEDAAIHYRHAVAAAPDNAEAHNNLGAVLEDLGRTEEAVDSYCQAIAINPGYAGAQMNLGAIYRKHGRPAEAASLYRTALEQQPDYPALHFNLGLALSDLADPAAAAESFRAAIARKPDYAAAHEKLGDALREQALFDDALDCYETALQHEPQRIDAHVNLATTLQELGRYDDAIARCRTALDIDPDSVTARHSLAHSYWRLERYEDALALFDALDSPTAKARALECLFAMKSFDAFYERQEHPAPGWAGNLRIAAINAFAADQLKHDDPHPYCKRPLDFIRVYDALEGRPDRAAYTADLIAQLEEQTAVWEPFGKSTVAGFQTPAVLFDEPEGPLAELRAAIEDHIARYRAETFVETCDYLDRFPAHYTLNAWYGKLVKGGHRLSHIHPSGWLSGVFYIQCPEGADPDEGAIEFSLWGYGYPVLNENYPRHRHRPKNGDLVLFPSSLFHGTVPIEIDAERLIVAFDLVPLA